MGVGRVDTREPRVTLAHGFPFETNKIVGIPVLSDPTDIRLIPKSTRQLREQATPSFD